MRGSKRAGEEDGVRFFGQSLEGVSCFGACEGKQRTRHAWHVRNLLEEMCQNRMLMRGGELPREEGWLSVVHTNYSCRIVCVRARVRVGGRMAPKSIIRPRT